LEFTVNSWVVANDVLEWDIYKDGSSTPIDSGTLTKNGTGIYATAKTNKLGPTGVYIVKGHLAGHNDWLTYTIDVTRTGVIGTEPPSGCSVVAYKVDENNKPLAGATLTLQQDGGGDIPRVYTAVSDKDGVVTFLNVESGTYGMSETIAPSGYTGSDDEYTIVVDGDVITDITEGRNKPKDYEPVTFVNKKNTAPTKKVVVYKDDEDGKPLAGATLRMDGKNEDDKACVYDEKSDNKGNVEFNVEYGTYTLSEFAAPSGYTGSSDNYKILVTANGVYDITKGTGNAAVPYEPVTFVNKKSSSSGGPTQTLTALKKDENGALLADATIRMSGKNEDGKALVYDAKSNSQGVVTFVVEYGEYTMTEHAAPAGYNATDDSYKIKVTKDGVYNTTDASTTTTTSQLVAYQPVTFVNRKIPGLNKDDHFAYMQGYPDGTFGPSLNMTRAEAVIMFSRLLNESMNLDKDYKSNYYPDINLNSWFANQVCYMHQLGVLAHYSRDGSFRPNEPVTRAEFATLAAHFDSLVLTDTNKFSDVADDHWAVKFINSASAKGWIVGYEDGTFRPEANISRDEVVTLVNRILERAADEAYLTANAGKLPRDYSDISSKNWSFLHVMEASIGHDFTMEGGKEKWTKVYD